MVNSGLFGKFYVAYIIHTVKSNMQKYFEIWWLQDCNYIYCIANQIKTAFANKWYHTYHSSLDNLNRFIDKFLTAFFQCIATVPSPSFWAGIIYSFCPTSFYSRYSWDKSWKFYCLTMSALQKFKFSAVGSISSSHLIAYTHKQVDSLNQVNPFV